MSDFPFRATILIPVYNVEKYLDGCISSLKEQTEPFENMEILLINDGSRDATKEILAELAAEHAAEQEKENKTEQNDVIDKCLPLNGTCDKTYYSNAACAGTGVYLSLIHI